MESPPPPLPTLSFHSIKMMKILLKRLQSEPRERRFRSKFLFLLDSFSSAPIPSSGLDWGLLECLTGWRLIIGGTCGLLDECLHTHFCAWGDFQGMSDSLKFSWVRTTFHFPVSAASSTHAKCGYALLVYEATENAFRARFPKECCSISKFDKKNFFFHNFGERKLGIVASQGCFWNAP